MQLAKCLASMAGWIMTIMWAICSPLTTPSSHCRVQCWAFSPPGGLLDPETADSTRKFTTSVVLGKDWIPRLTLDSFERLRDEMVSLMPA